MPRILVAIAWWPTKSKCLFEVVGGLQRGLQGIDENSYEVFIHSSVAETKFQSIVASMADAFNYARSQGFTHILCLDADVKLGDRAVLGLLQLKQGLVVAVHSGRADEFSCGFATYETLINGCLGWACMLVELGIVEKVPFQESGFSHLPPDRMWFKRLLGLDFPIWIDTLSRPVLLD